MSLQSPNTNSVTASFAEVDIRDALASRPPRTPDYEAENRALASLAAELAKNPQNMLQKLVETALELCHADTAGVSLLENHDGVEVFRWEALAGVFAAARNSTMPRNASPCGVCIDQNTTELMYLADRAFPALLNEPRFVEALLIPFHFQGRPIGTVWVVTHRLDRKFDREDERVMRTLSAFASTGWQLWMANAELEARVRERTMALWEKNAALKREIEDRKLAEKLLRRSNDKIQGILESTPDRFFALGHDWRFTYLNKHAQEQMKLLGKDPESLIGKVLWDEFPNAANEEALRRVMSERVAITVELYYAPLGEWIENHIFPTADGGLATFQRYITERKRAEGERSASGESTG
jgi:PAS domain-containing protein